MVLQERHRPRRADGHAGGRRAVRRERPEERRGLSGAAGRRRRRDRDAHLWHTPRRGARDTPSPIVVGDFIIVTDMDGVFTCYSAKDGHIYWKERLEGKYSGSPLAANGLVYFTNEDGKTFVIKPGPKLEVVAENAADGGQG